MSTRVDHRRRTRHRSRALVTSVGVALVLVLAMPATADAAPKNVTPAKWARTVCTGVDTWLDLIGGRSPITPTREAVTARTAFATYLADAIAATDALVKTLKSTGRPGVPNGAVMAKLVVSTFSGASTSLGNAATTVAGLPTTDITAFNAAAVRLQTQIQGIITMAGQQLSTVTTKYRSTKLDRAFAAEPTCQLGNTGATATAGGTTSTTTATTSQPTCNAVSLLAAAKVKSPSAASVDTFQCGNGWAGAGVTLNAGSSGGVATAMLFKAQGATWVAVDRTAQNCNDPTVPAAVHVYCTVS